MIAYIFGREHVGDFAWRFEWSKVVTLLKYYNLMLHFSL